MMKKIFFAFMAILYIACDSVTVLPPNPDGGTDETSTIVELIYTNDNVVVKNPMSNRGVSVTAEGTHVLINANTVVENVEYILSGECATGSIKIYSNVKLILTLNGLDLRSSKGPAINIQTSKNISVQLPDGTINKLADSNQYEVDLEEDARGTFFSEGQLVFSGNGHLEVKGNYKHAIASDDYIEINGGTFVVNCDSSDGFHVNDYFVCNAGKIDITCTGMGGDGIDCGKGYIEINGGEITINTVDKGIVTALDTIENPSLAGVGIQSYIAIKGGTIHVTTTGERGHAIDTASDIIIADDAILHLSTSGERARGLDAANDIMIKGGVFNINTIGERAHAINATRNILLNGGEITIRAMGDKSDGLNCGGNLDVQRITSSIIADDDCYQAETYSGDLTLLNCM